MPGSTERILGSEGCRVANVHLEEIKLKRSSVIVLMPFSVRPTLEICWR